MTLNERINNIRLILQKPFHFFTLLQGKSIKTSLVILVLEDNEGNRFSFQGNSIMESIENAEKYIEGEKKMGSLRDKSEDEKTEKIIETTENLQEKNEEETQQEKNEENEENTQKEKK